MNDQNLRILLFGGKGGVGKTTCATTTALRLAKRSPRGSFLLVSTDPAHSLADSLAGAPSPDNLTIIELDAQECLAAFKAEHSQKLREIALQGTFLDEDDIRKFLDLSLPGMDELMALLEIAKWVQDSTYDRIIVDTAPTGHTMRLLSMPKLIRRWLGTLDAILAKHRYMRTVFSRSCRPDELDEFLTQLSSTINRTQTLLCDPVRCRFVPVMTAEVLSVHETELLLASLNDFGVPVSEIVLNKLYSRDGCGVCKDARERQQRALRALLTNGVFSPCTFWGVPLYPEETLGMENLDTFWEGATLISGITLDAPRELAPMNVRVEAVPAHCLAERALLLFAGKGGVGKTTLSCATALRLSHDSREKEVFLFSTDPAHSLSVCLDVQVGARPVRIAPRLSAMEIDAQAELDLLKAQYQTDLAQFLKSTLPNFDLVFDREVMERILDMSPPGLDEIMALTHVTEALKEGSYDIFVLDSAPTGHLIRLLELPELIDQWINAFFELLLKYRTLFRLPRVSQRLVRMSKELKHLRSVLNDPARSGLIIVSIPTEMAFQETLDLVSACKRMHVHVPLMLINLVTPETECRLCSTVHRGEKRILDNYQRVFPEIPQAVVCRNGDLRGLQRLSDLGNCLYKSVFKESISCPC